MYSRLFELLIEAVNELKEMTDVNDPHTRNCKLCGHVAHRVRKGAKKGTRRYECGSTKLGGKGGNCQFSWAEKDTDAPATPKDIGKLKDWGDKSRAK